MFDSLSLPCKVLGGHPVTCKFHLTLIPNAPTNFTTEVAGPSFETVNLPTARIVTELTK